MWQKRATKASLIYTEHGHHNWHGPIWFSVFIVLYKHWWTSGGPVITQYRIRHESLSRNTPLVISVLSLLTLNAGPNSTNTKLSTPHSPPGLVKGSQSGSGVGPTSRNWVNALMSSTASEFISVNTGACVRWMGGGVWTTNQPWHCCKDRAQSSKDCDQWEEK